MSYWLSHPNDRTQGENGKKAREETEGKPGRYTEEGKTRKGDIRGGSSEDKTGNACIWGCRYPCEVDTHKIDMQNWCINYAKLIYAHAYINLDNCSVENYHNNLSTEIQ